MTKIKDMTFGEAFVAFFTGVLTTIFITKCFKKKSKNIKKPFGPVSIEINSIITKGNFIMTRLELGLKSFILSFGAPVDKKGNAAQVENLRIESTDDSIATLEAAPSGNPYAVKVNLTGKAGAFQVIITADSDLGEGVEEISQAETFEMPSGKAVAFGQAEITGKEFEGETDSNSGADNGNSDNGNGSDVNEGGNNTNEGNGMDSGPADDNGEIGNDENSNSEVV